jgi:hypothetical protein
MRATKRRKKAFKEIMLIELIKSGCSGKAIRKKPRIKKSTIINGFEIKKQPTHSGTLTWFQGSLRKVYRILK